MPDEPPSQMIRVPTPLIGAFRELSRLHRGGRTRAVLEGIERLREIIDSNTAIDIDSVSESISRLTERLERLESERSDSKPDIDIASAIQPISERLKKVEADIESIAITIADLNVRVSDLEGVGDISYAVTPLSELSELENENFGYSPNHILKTKEVTGDLADEPLPELPDPFPKEGLSTKELAHLTGVTVQQVNRIRCKGQLRDWKGGWRAVKINQKEHRYYPAEQK
jgi:hypothetical protein